MSVSRDVRDQADELKGIYKDLSSFEALQIATKIIEVEAYRQAHVIDCEGAPSALEAIAICLGQGGQFSNSITDAVNEVANSPNNVSNAIEATKEHQE